MPGEADSLTLTQDPAGSGLYTAYATGTISPATSGDNFSDPDCWKLQAFAGDRISVAAATPDSDLDAYVQLHNLAGGVLVSDDSSGAGSDAFISDFLVPSSGTYYVLVGKNYSSTVSGGYQLRVDLARGVDLESDANYANDSLAGADPLDLTRGSTGRLVGAVAGTVMGDEGVNTDDDLFSIGWLDPDNTVALNLQLPAGSSLNGRVTLVNSGGGAIPDADGDPNDGSFSATVTVSDEYYALVQANSGEGPLAQYLLGVDITDAAEPTVISVTGLPGEGATSGDVISSISLTFSERMAPDTVLADGALTLREAGSDGAFGSGDDRLISLVRASDFNEFSRQIGFFLQGGPLSSGSYRFEVAASVADRAGNPLDGNGDGTGGDPFYRAFTLELPATYILEGADNGSLATATGLPLTEATPDGGLFLAYGLGSVDPADDQDWWSFAGRAGDKVAVAVEADGSLRARTYLYDAGGSLRADDSFGDDGPGTDAYISHYVLPADGTYHVRVSRYTGELDSYRLRLELARGIDLESDANYANDSLAGADPLTLTQQGGSRAATVAGTIMAGESYANLDEDSFALGLLNAGNVVELGLRRPGGSTAAPQVRLLDGSGNAVADEDGDASNGFRATITASGFYYAQVASTEWVHDGRRYVYGPTPRTWQQAEGWAQGLGGHLVTVDDQAEQDWLHRTLGVMGEVWIGLNDHQTEGAWVWADGTPVAYTNWAGGEPNGGGNYDGAYLAYGNGRWYDHYNNNGLAAVAELDAAGAPESGPGRDRRRATCWTWRSPTRCRRG